MKTPFIYTFISMAICLFSCAEDGQKTDKNQEKTTNLEAEKIEENEVVDTIKAEAIYMKVSQPDEILAEFESTLRSKEKIRAFIGVDETNELMITHVTHEGDRHIIFNQASDRVSLNLTYLNEDEIEPAFRISIRHKLKDYETWKWLFDGDKQGRENAGMVLVQMGTVEGDPNEAFMIFAIPDIAKAREIINKPNMRKKMKQGGVIGDPEIKFWRPISTDQEKI